MVFVGKARIFVGKAILRFLGRSNGQNLKTGLAHEDSGLPHEDSGLPTKIRALPTKIRALGTKVRGQLRGQGHFVGLE